MREVRFEGDGGRSLTLSREDESDADAVWAYVATLEVPEGSVSTRVWDLGFRLAPFVREIADAWRGFDGAREYGSLEGQMELRCTHDGLGTVMCDVTLRRASPPGASLHDSGLGLEHISKGSHPRSRRS